MVTDILNKYKKLVWPEIKKYLKDPKYPRGFEIPEKYKKIAHFHWKTVNEYPLRKGKYLRPTLLLLTCEALGGKTKDALKTAAAMQLSEEWLLAHDDFEDDSLERRGLPTLHRLYGNELAINAGDALQIIMWKVLADNQKILGPKKAYLVQDEFHKILTRTALGQGVEIKWTKDNKLNLGDSDWYFICDGKTSYYTIAGPMRLGAIIAGAKTRELKIVTKFGINLGRCFQLINDILDITSDFKGLKKQVGNDIYEGKRTVMLGHLLRNAKPDDRAKIIKILAKGRDAKTQAEVGWIIKKMHEYKSIDYARNLAKKFKNNAQEIFEKEMKFLDKKPYRNYLSEIITFILEREY